MQYETDMLFCFVLSVSHVYFLRERLLCFSYQSSLAHITSLVVSVNALYSASVVDNETVR
jgi:hypothetical protein